MWDYSKITSINLEASSLCNAFCGYCSRYEENTTIKNPEMVETYISFDKFKQYFPKELLAQINYWTFSGDYGDACTNPDLVQILDYMFSVTPEVTINICTNGGMRNIGFWDSLGNVMKTNPNATITFSIDGLKDTNHLYRRGVIWDKLMSNVRAYMATGARAYWDFLLFKHNEHQVEDVKELAKLMRFDEVFIKSPNGLRFGSMKIQNDDGRVLYEIESSGDNKVQPLPEKDPSLKMEEIFKDEVGEIKCFSARNGQEVRISVEGIVYPCCHIGAIAKTQFKVSQDVRKQVNGMIDYSAVDLNKESLYNILNNKPFSKIESSWQDKSCAVCWVSCGVNEKKKSTLGQIFSNGDYGKS